jgi:hypothetical protein
MGKRSTWTSKDDDQLRALAELGHKPVGESTLSRAIKRGALSANRT